MLSYLSKRPLSIQTVMPASSGSIYTTLVSSVGLKVPEDHFLVLDLGVTSATVAWMLLSSGT